MSGKLVVTGDFNFHYENVQSNETVEFRKLIFSLNLDQHITQPTHIHGHMLDLVLTRSTDSIVNDLIVHPAEISDHSPITLSLPYRKPNAKKKTITYRKLNDIDMDSFLKDLTASQLCTNPPNDLDQLVEMYNDTLGGLLESHAPLQTKQVKVRSQAKWFDEEILAARCCRRKAEKKWRKTELNVHLDIYKEKARHVKRLCKNAKKRFYERKIDECNDDQKKLFRITEELMHTKNNSVLPTHADAVALANQFADFFESKIAKIREEFSDIPEFTESEMLNSVCLESFDPVSEVELRKLIMAGNSKSCMLDPIPTTLLKASLDTLLPVLVKIVNLSLTTSTVPSKFKMAVVFPLIKKLLLERENFKNYRPVSSLPFIGKITEKVVVKQMNTHMTVNEFHDLFQSAYRVGHSTETALVYVYNDLLDAVDNKQCVLLTLLDLSAAFDTINHSLLLDRFERDMGITGAALEWLRSYFSNREQFVHVNGASSRVHELSTGMPQGSVIGPFGFPTYQSPLSRIFRMHNMMYHLYADDSQVYVCFKPTDGNLAKERLEKCIADVSAWMHDNHLKLNHSKTECIVIGSKHTLQQVQNVSELKVGNATVACANSVKNIGAVFDSQLTMVEQVGATCRSCYMHVRNIGRIRPFLSQSATEKLVHAFISSKLDYNNALLYGLPTTLIGKLQKIQNCAARIVTRTCKRAHITPILSSLHWLPVAARIKYKILLLTFKCIHGTAPAYLCKLIRIYQPRRSLRSEDQHLLTQGNPRTKAHGDRAFKNCAPILWNALPQQIRVIDEVESFKSAVKTYLFKEHFK